MMIWKEQIGILKQLINSLSQNKITHYLTQIEKKVIKMIRCSALVSENKYYFAIKKKKSSFFFLLCHHLILTASTTNQMW